MLDGLARWLFDPSGLTPHGFCLVWEPWLIWTHAASDVAIGLAYFSIPLALAAFARRRRDLAFRPVFWLFAAFILLCGTGHWLDLLTLWVPAYRAEGLVMAATAAVSVLTAIALWRLLPRALALPSPAQLQEANAALRESEARHRASFERSPVPVHTLDGEGVVTGVSDSWLALLGYTHEGVVGRHIGEFLAPGSDRWAEADRARLLARGEVRDLERRFLRRDGAVVEALVSARLERRGETVLIVCVLIDVTARRRTEEALRASEERLRQAQKMEAVGRLTGGVAHDFNNVLTAVMGNLELIRIRVRDERPDVARLADTALDAAGKAAGLTAQMLSFSRQQRLDPKPLDPVEVVDGMYALLARTAGERIALHVEAEAGVGLCLADRNQLESALLNLAINARDAIDGPGAITVSVRAERLAGSPEDWPPAGDYVRIAVGDDGCGMAEEVCRRAFEPFFTTKGPGRGTGLGLAQIHGFAHQSGGTATIESAPGRGTEVAILLPRAGADAPNRPPGPRDATVEVLRGEGETVLLVEDDALVRATLAATLHDLGYRVLEAGDAEAGVAALVDAGVDAVLTDFTMPGTLDGLEFVNIAQARRPGLPAVLLTGHLDPLRSKRLPEGVAFLQKPCDRVQMATTLRRVLAGAAKPVPA